MEDRDVSFGFAISNNVMYDAENAEIVFNDRAHFSTILEVNRCMANVKSIKNIDGIEYESFVKQYYAERRGTSAEAMEGIDEVMDMDEVAQTLEKESDLLEGDDDAPVIRLLNSIFFEALKTKASDIHIEPYENSSRIRYRINGVMNTVLTPPQKVIPLLISRIKVLAKLDIAEKRIPQDGRMSILLGGRPVDLRISSLPSSYGERAVLRLLDKQNQHISVEDLGMEPDNVKKLEQLILRPHGIMLVTGPTGSGKTTTLYAALQRMDRNLRNIMTVEDPVEYDLPGISQTQVNNKTGMTFSKSLRAILRQDPDVVLIGEIRDRETAEIAIQASLTGHLVLATLHTNSASGAVTRLQDLGIDRFLLASTLRGIMAQRLVRKLCSCSEKGNLGYEPVGCVKCSDSGFDGRQGIFELVPIDASMQELIHDGASEAELETLMRIESLSIKQAGDLMIEKGITTASEVLRVTSE